MNHTAYAEDFIPWVETQAALLRDHRFELPDIPNLYDLLRCRYQPLRKSRNWRKTLLEQRSRIELLVKHFPGLRHDLADESASVYPLGARNAARTTGLAHAVLPAALPFTGDELLDYDFAP